MRLLALALAVLTLAHGVGAADHPSAPFANELIEARVYLPDPEKGYYRGTRFDWSGVESRGSAPTVAGGSSRLPTGFRIAPVPQSPA